MDCWATVMNSFWRFLRDKRNQQVLGWLGGGLVVAATGLWAAFVYFSPPVKSFETTSSQPAAPAVQANCGVVAIGRDVTGSAITACSSVPSTLPTTYEVYPLPGRHAGRYSIVPARVTITV